MDRTREILDRFVAWSPVLLLGALAALTYWLDAQVQSPPARRDGSTRHDPDLFLQDFKAITFDAQGNARETLSAVRAEHFPDDESAELTKPRLSLAEMGRPTLTITADHGRIDGDRSNGDFSGSVRVERDADPHASPNGGAAGPVTLSTSALHVTTKEERVQTREAVTIEDPRGIIHGKGLEFDNKAKTLRLDSQVSGTFQPQVVPK
jgi:lipopolysaccharide export system protein LptC